MQHDLPYIHSTSDARNRLQQLGVQQGSDRGIATEAKLVQVIDYLLDQVGRLERRVAQLEGHIDG